MTKIQASTSSTSVKFIAGTFLILIGLALRPSFIATILTAKCNINDGRLYWTIIAIQSLFVASGCIFCLKVNSKKVRESSWNIIILILTTGTFLLIFELIFPRILIYLPLAHHSHIHPVWRILSQSSKKGMIPQDYIALVGDSNAAGAGDWLLESNRWGNGPFHSAHILSERMQKDVISFGVPGADNITGIASAPRIALTTLRNRFVIADPKTIFVYFYEGNDLNDNLKHLMKLQGINPKNFTKIAFNEAVNREIAASQNCNSNSHLIGAYFIAHLISDGINQLRGGIKPTFKGTRKMSDCRKARVNGNLQIMPEVLHGPPDIFSQEDFEPAFSSFEYSLEILIRNFPNSKIVVVYLPSALAIYDFVVTKESENCAKFDANTLRNRHNTILSRIRSICAKQNIAVLDTTEDLRTSSRKNLLHGPTDWWHFNRSGYEVISDAIVQFVNQSSN